MQKTLRVAVLVLGAVFFASSLTFAQAPTPAPDAPVTQQHAKTTKTKKRSGRKSSRKKTARKKPVAQNQ